MMLSKENIGRRLQNPARVLLIEEVGDEFVRLTSKDQDWLMRIESAERLLKKGRYQWVNETTVQFHQGQAR